MYVIECMPFVRPLIRFSCPGVQRGPDCGRDEGVAVHHSHEEGLPHRLSGGRPARPGD